MVRLFDASATDAKPPAVIGIDRVVSDPTTNTVFAESNDLLE
jgi:hypothetical protein